MALKLRRTEAGGALRRWVDEARALARVRHPNVLTVHGADEHDGRVGLWTDLVRGRDLESILQRDGSVLRAGDAAVGLDLCAALSAVHARGLVHGDVKTRNVMRDDADDSPGRIVLMDFGSAHEASLAMTAGRGTSIGTPLAMAPEALRGEAATRGVGSLLAGCAAVPSRDRALSDRGRRPWPSCSAKHAAEDRASLRTLRPDLRAPFVQAVEHALEPDPRRRFADAAAMERALHAAVSGATPSRPGRGCGRSPVGAGCRGGRRHAIVGPWRSPAELGHAPAPSGTTSRLSTLVASAREGVLGAGSGRSR